jgi:cyclopropane-fatty-acyl-phospholipid synthase
MNATMLLASLLRRLVRVGRLTLIDAGGAVHRFGDGDENASAVTIRVHDPSLHWRLALRPELVAGEAYMDGTLTVEDGSIYDFLDLIGRNVARSGKTSVRVPTSKLRRLLRRVRQFNPVARAERNVAHHYDLTGTLYELFLDSDRQYSCAYFSRPDDSLETAQERKKRHIAAKLRLRPGMRVLDIGCGWGGLALYLAEHCGADVTGITLSREQLDVATERAAERGLSDRVRFELRDYRALTGTYDRIVSVGMFEHVGVNHYRTYFRTVNDRLADDGIALVHTIGRCEPPGGTNPWLQKYIFPGGYTPALSEVVAAIERAPLYTTDVEILRLHYAETLRHWRARFLHNRPAIAGIYDERFCRMWEFYLAACEISFRYLRLVVFQIQLTRSQEALPIIRDYMVDDERALRAAADDEHRRVGAA